MLAIAARAESRKKSRAGENSRVHEETKILMVFELRSGSKTNPSISVRAAGC